MVFGKFSRKLRFGREIRLMVCECLKLNKETSALPCFAKFAKDTPKYELQIVKYPKAQYAP